MANKPLDGSTAVNPGITRRSLLKWSSLAAAGVAALGTTGCAGFNESTSPVGSDVTAEGGTWIPCSCWADCGSKGFNKALVKNGEVVRMGTDQTHEDSPDCPQLRACARGRSLRGMIFGADRIKYPMKRKNWQPGGGENAHGELRGRDEWERISWDEALQLVSDEIKRVIAEYGNEGILMPGGVPQRLGDFELGRMMYLMGGCLEQTGAVSSGAWTEMAKLIGLTENTNDRMDLRKSDLIVLWASNPAWSRTGAPTYDYLQCKNAGVKFISVDVHYNATARALTDEFIAVRPGTDAAMLIAMCYVLLTQDDPENDPLVDWDFLDRCCIGFDADHMPEDADPKDNFADYVLGTYDGQPKTPEWASEICGAPAESIEKLALEIARTERAAIIMSPAPARTGSGAQLCQALLSFGAMAGCLGKPGCCAASDAGHAWMQGGWNTLHKGGAYLGSILKDTVGAGELYIGNPLEHKKVNVNQMWTSIVNEEPYIGLDGKEYENPAHLIFDRHENFLNQGPGTMLGIEAYRKMDTVIAANIVMTTTCKYADIVLPVTSMWERYGVFEQAYREQMIWTSQVCEPLFECKSDLEIALALADYLGVDKQLLAPNSEKQTVFNTVAEAKVLNKDGVTWDNLVTITESDIQELGVEGTPQEGLVPILDLKRDGIYTIERTEDDGRNYVPLKAFREDPEGNPLKTQTGKLEIYCKAAVEKSRSFGFVEIDPIAKYVPPTEGYESTFADWETKEKGEYPYQFLNLHILRHSHSTFGNVPNLREAFDHPLYMNPIDAQKESFETGDTVLVTSHWGKVLRPVLVTDIVTPGVVCMGQGAWVEIDEETGIDKAGCSNVLCGPNLTSMGYQSWNTCVVRVDKWDGEPLAPDHLWDAREVFKED
ncbi:molybdopterin-dependent oxidoreductase [Senegalimassilia anaerobia]|uniref:Dimethyl sulfoxide reductase subunit A n=1 Tax=Senegalimassilia anaerobia TaxID=1473216 RepID=A0A369L8G0_9ACTN|nr:molybdopterin-dependent oxidoreductase [Senegalimassilia anaerobia]RDB55019.1 dimethyl sulfoxide reductase subunit A [Senegalimassilia anaerobia]